MNRAEAEKIVARDVPGWEVAPDAKFKAKNGVYMVKIVRGKKTSTVAIADGQVMATSS